MVLLPRWRQIANSERQGVSHYSKRNEYLDDNRDHPLLHPLLYLGLSRYRGSCCCSYFLFWDVVVATAPITNSVVKYVQKIVQIIIDSTWKAASANLISSGRILLEGLAVDRAFGTCGVHATDVWWMRIFVNNALLIIANVLAGICRLLSSLIFFNPLGDEEYNCSCEDNRLQVCDRFPAA